MPRNERVIDQDGNPDPEDDSPISLWGASESTTTTTRDRDASSMKEDILVRLLDAVERLEGRMDARDAAVVRNSPLPSPTKKQQNNTQ